MFVRMAHIIVSFRIFALLFLSICLKAVSCNCRLLMPCHVVLHYTNVCCRLTAGHCVDSVLRVMTRQPMQTKMIIQLLMHKLQVCFLSVLLIFSFGYTHIFVYIQFSSPA